MQIPTFTLLIVEDLATHRELYREHLSHDSNCVYDVLEAESVAGALTLCRTKSIDAIVLDYGLPDGDGLEFLAALKTQSNGISPPVVMVTGVGDQGIAVRAMKLGAEDYLVKSELTPELLQSTMRMAIENTRLRLQLLQSQEQAELTLQAKNQQITTIWESMTDAYVTLDRDWRVVYGNSAAIEVFSQLVDLAPEEFLGKTHWEIFPWSVGSIVEREYRRAMTEQVAVNFEIFYDPAQAWFEIHAYPSVESLGVYFRDITERKRLEQERDRFFDLSIDLLIVANLEGYFIQVNPACEQILGFTSAEMMAQPFLDFVHPDDLAATMAIVESLSAGDVLVNFENRYYCKDGSYRWILWSAIPDVDRNVIYVNGHDITDRKRDDEALLRSEELNRRILDSHRDCVKVVDLEGRLLYMNDGGQRLMEIDDFTTVEGTQWVEFWQGNDAESVRAALAAAKSGEIGKFEGYCATFKDTPKWWEVVATPIFDRHGNVEQILSVSRDITDRKQTALRLQAQQATIQQQLGEIESIYQAAPIGLSCISNELKFVRINEQLAQINGLAVAEHIGLTIRDVLPELADAVEPLYRQVIESGKPIFDLEVSGSTPSQPGVERHWVASYYPQTDLSGRVVGVNAMVQEITDRKRLEAKRLSAEQERDRFFNLSVDLLAIGNFDGYFTRLNPAWEQILGYTNAELMARPFVELIHPDDREITIAAFRQGQIDNTKSTDFENRYRCKDGSYRWLSWSTMPYPEQNLMYGSARDITDRKRLEAARLAAEQERDRFFSQSIDLLAIGNFDGYFERINPAFERLLGFTETEFVSRPFIDFVHPDDREATLAAAQSLAEGEILVDFENRCQCKDGSDVWVSWTATPYQQSNCWYGVGRDISLRKSQSAALLQSERKFSAIFNQTFQLMGLVSLDGALLEVNQAALDSIAASESEIIGKSFWDAPWWHTEQLQQQLRDAIATAASGKFVRYEVEFLNPSGGITITDFSLKPMFDEVGQVESIVAEAHDITDRKQAQAALEQRNQELDSFVYIVSHDLKAPLRGIASLSEWIEEDFDGSLSVVNQEQMTLLRSRIYKMQATIDGLLDYARSGSAVERIESVSIAELLADVIDQISPPPTFTIELPPELPTLSTRRLPLFQVLANLIGNGIKHHDAEDGSIQISVEDWGDCYEFSIADNGPGIAPEHHDRMFKIFQAVNPQNRSDSTGIGLAIVKKIVEAEGGTIWLESELGKGTTFYFTWLQH